MFQSQVNLNTVILSIRSSNIMTNRLQMVSNSHQLIVTMFLLIVLTLPQKPIADQKFVGNNICESCEGKICQDDFLPPHARVEYPSVLTLHRLNKAIISNFELERLNSQDLDLREQLVDSIRNMLRPTFPQVKLAIYGSVASGLGLRSSSDIDICLKEPHDSSIVSETQLNDDEFILKKVAKTLVESGKTSNIVLISARKTILRFHHIDFKFDVDLQFCKKKNVTGENSLLLKQYVNHDIRVAQLGLFLKKLVKLSGVADTFHGGLASTAWILMLIYFLQNHEVPVLPVMQELEEWDELGKNQESVAQLWLTFLNFYVEKFDYDNYVVSIRQSKSLSKSEKSWFTDGLAIEDPIEKFDNFGSRLTRQRSVGIMSTLQNHREFFHRSTDKLSSDVNFLDYYTEVKRIKMKNLRLERGELTSNGYMMDGYSYIQNKI